MYAKRVFKTWLVATGCILLNACEPSSELTIQPDGNGAAVLGMSAPSFLADPRMVDQSLLVLDLTANNISVPVSQDENGIWRGTINFDPLQDVNLIAAWSEMGSTLLPLASARRSFTVPDDPAGVVVNITENRFTTNFDSDGDGRSNIAELRNNSDPRNGTSPGTTPEQLPVSINFGVPVSLQGESDAVIRALSLTVLVNGEVPRVTRIGNVWMGQTMEIAGNDVFIEANFFSNSSRVELLNRFELRQPLGTNGLFIGLDTEGPNP